MSVPPDRIKRGPADDRMFVVDAVNKLPYSRFFRPPYLGTANPPVEPGPELDASREIRVAFNYARISDVGEEPHDRSLPLTGGIFDIMVEVFEKGWWRATSSARIWRTGPRKARAGAELGSDPSGVPPSIRGQGG